MRIGLVTDGLAELPLDELLATAAGVGESEGFESRNGKQ